jgi:hypothetical protein
VHRRIPRGMKSTVYPPKPAVVYPSQHAIPAAKKHASQVELSPIEDPYQFHQHDCTADTLVATAENPDASQEDATPLPPSKQHRHSSIPHRHMQHTSNQAAQCETSAAPKKPRERVENHAPAPRVRQVRSRQPAELVTNANKRALILASKVSPVSGPRIAHPGRSDLPKSMQRIAPSNCLPLPERSAAAPVPIQVPVAPSGSPAGLPSSMVNAQESGMLAWVASMSRASAGQSREAAFLAAGRFLHEMMNRQGPLADHPAPLSVYVYPCQLVPVRVSFLIHRIALCSI